MNCDGTKWDIYDDFLKQKRYVSKNHNIEYAQNSLYDLANNDASFQKDATRNGELQPLLALREADNTCKITIMPEDEMFVGDIVGCYGEHWIVVDVYTDEYGITTGTMWLCNHLLKFQNYGSDILETYCVIDDGTYSKLTQKSITTAEAQYSMYLPLNSDTEKFYIDKRFAISDMYNKQGQKVLQVMQATWIDKIYQSGGKGNHLLKIRLQSDVYDANKDSVEHMVCDYIDKGENDGVNNGNVIEETPEKVLKEEVKTEEISQPTVENVIQNNIEIKTNYSIDGRNTIRIGTSRNYTLMASQIPSNIEWKIDLSDVSHDDDKNVCRVHIPLDEQLLGHEITLEAYSDGQLLCSKVIRVVTIG